MTIFYVLIRVFYVLNYKNIVEWNELGERIKLLDMMKTYPLNSSQQKLAEFTGVTKTTISHILLQEEKLQQKLLWFEYWIMVWMVNRK